jgi:hypothetical protein
VLSLFKQATSKSLCGYVLQTPQHKAPLSIETDTSKGQGTTTSEKSPRLQQKNNSGKVVSKLAQELLAKKYGITSEDEGLDDLTLQQYLDLYKQPLSENSMKSILSLTEVAVDKGKKKKKKKKQAKTKASEKVPGDMLGAAEEISKAKKDKKAKK